jgi:ferredoxin-NADP reductase
VLDGLNRGRWTAIDGVFSVIITMILGCTPTFAQVSPSDHASHHPAAEAAPMNMSPAAGGMASGQGAPAPSTTDAMADMMKMMSPSSAATKSSQGAAGCCGAAGPKPFYPSMMDFPSLTVDARRVIKSLANERLGAGAQKVSAGQVDLHHAQSSHDLAGAQEAARGVREGLSLVESGVSALQALNEAQPPRRIALTWFRREMSLGDGGEMRMDGGFRDISWLHWTAMLLLAGALLTALLLRWSRLRRISDLAQRLTPGGQPPRAAAVGASASAPSPAPSSPDAQKAASPVPVADSPRVALAAPVQRPWKGVLRIKSIFDETPTVKTFRLMEANLASIPFTFLPGQYATVTSEIDGHKVRRSYTISSSPTQRDYIELTVKREQYGLESRHLHDHARTGDLLEVSAPAGRFFFTGKEADGIVLMAGGVGITPMMSVLRYLTDKSYHNEIHLLYGVNAPCDLIFREECAYLARRHPNVHIVSVVSKPEGTDWAGPVGYMTAELITQCVPDIARRRIHLCGPPAMMEAVKATLLQLKVPPEQIKTEDFAPPKGGPVVDPEPESAPAAPPDSASSGSAAPGARAPSAQASVTFSKSNKTGQLAPDQSVLEAAEAIGVVIDFECRVGTCGRCKVPLSEGVVTMEVEDALSAEEKSSGIILACQAKSAQNLVVDA